MAISIHANNAIEWHRSASKRFKAGLRVLGLESEITPSASRQSDIAILLGTTCWKDIERTGKYLLVDRASIGDPDFVQLVWDGHGRRGDHKVPHDAKCRPIFPEPEPWRFNPGHVVLCGQHLPYSPNYAEIHDWYNDVKQYATHFRPHPRFSHDVGLPILKTWDGVGKVITLNSSVGVESVVRGIPTVTLDEGAMAWSVTTHNPQHTHWADRKEWLRWLSWTQWSWDEIESGEPIRHLFEEL